MVKRRTERDKSKYVSYIQLKEYVRKNNILTKEQYIKHISVNYLFEGRNIPYNPSTFYTKDIWEGWSIFLRGEVYKKNYNGIYYTYDECKKTVKKYNFTSKRDFLKKIKDVIKEDIRIPYSPSTIYKKEWEGWIEFLDTDNVNSNEVQYLSFEDARKFARSLQFKLIQQWKYLDNDILKSYSIPKKAHRTYSKKGWIDWYDFLGIDKKTKMSHGEVIISNVLDRKNIKYKYNKSLKDCISSSKLRFDFYLPDYNLCIEFDGIQHYKPVDIFGGEEEFLKTQMRDKIKNQWCELNNIKLIRFNYMQSVEVIESVITKNLN